MFFPFGKPHMRWAVIMSITNIYECVPQLECHDSRAYKLSIGRKRLTNSAFSERSLAYFFWFSAQQHSQRLIDTRIRSHSSLVFRPEELFKLSRIESKMWWKWKYKIMFCLRDTIKCDLHLNGFFKVKHQICSTNDSIIIFHVIRLFWLCNWLYRTQKTKKKKIHI